MFHSSPLTRFSTLLLLLSRVAAVFSEDNITTPSCYDNFNAIYAAEFVANLNQQRTYILCPETRFEPGAISANGQGFEGNQVPLVLRSRALVKCGDDGSSKNNCIIDGSGTFGVIVGAGIFPEFESRNVIIQGLTFQDFGFTGEVQSFISYQVSNGKLTVRDCIFEFGSSEPMFTFNQLLFGRRNRELSNGEIDEKEYADQLTELFGPPGVERLLKMQKHSTNQNTKPGMDNRKIIETDNYQRSLQSGNNLAYNIFIENCTFTDHSYPRSPRTPGGLSLLNFQTLSVTNINDNGVGNINANIKQCVFERITAGYSTDAEESHRSVIEFYSSGRIVMEDLCFDDITLSAHGPSALVILHKDANDVNINLNSIYSPTVKYVGDAEPKCQFISKYEVSQSGSSSAFVECGLNASATSCFNEPVDEPEAPDGGFFACFSSKNTVQVMTGGNSIVHRRQMDKLKLGDLVLVDRENQKYEPIYSFGHRHTTQTAQFVRLMPSRLELSSQHLIFLQDGRAVPAGLIQVGDILESGQIITGLRWVTRHTGVYSPFTNSGKIVVNDQVASTFVSLQPDSDVLLLSGWSTGITHQWLAHTFELPHSLWCSYKGCTEEIYTVDGVSTWVSSPLRFFLWVLDAKTTNTVSFLFITFSTLIFGMGGFKIYCCKKYQ